MNRFTEKNIVVTGAASGIGRATALRLAQEGGRIWCVDLNEAGLRQTVDEIRSRQGTAEYRLLDVTSYNACEQVVQELLQQWGHLDVLCNIAGVAGMKRFEEETPAHFQRMLSINVVGPFNLCRVSVEALLKSKGVIINLASVAGQIGQAYTSSYAASKHALVGLTKSLAMEYGRKGLRANAICPGAVNTPLIGGMSFPKDIELNLIDRYNFLPWFADPEEVAAMVAYAASDEARYVNGAVLAIDGGISAG